ncbi:MAG TPA: tryptophan 7-halogenase [Cellvibrio sp.]|nr:tryptophan 7-halogenase [Cellvibrio sp.]
MTTKNIVIVGGGAAGWSVACLLAKNLPPELVKISVVDEQRKDLGQVEVARSSIHRFHELIGLHEKQFMLNTDASFSLGLWCQDAHKNYMLVEGPYGAPLEGIDFQSVYYKSVLLGSSHMLGDYSLNAVAASLGRFGHPVADPKSIYSSIQYGLHLELDSYSNMLKAHALALGVEVIGSDLSRVNLSRVDMSINGDAIESVDLMNGQQLSADLFIDCTGELSVLLGDSMGVASYADPLDQIFDSVAVGYRPLSLDAKPVTQLITTENGYLKITPLKHQECVSYTYSSRFSSDDLITQEIAALNVSNVVFSPLDCKKNKQYWVKNCVAIGCAAASFYELFISPMSLVRSAAVRLVDLLTDFDDFTFSIDEYNRLTHVESEQLRELAELYFYFGRSSNAGIREYFNSNELSASAQHRLDLFACAGRHPHQSAHFFSTLEWASFFVGNQILPRTCNLDVDIYDSKRLIQYVESLKAAIYKAAEKMPLHKDYIARLAFNK